MMTRSPFLMWFRFKTLANLQTSRCSCWYVKVTFSPGSPSQISAALFRVAPSRCRSRQFSATFNFPPTNHFAKGSFQSRTFFHFVCQQRSSEAFSAQNFCGFLIDLRYSSRYSSKLEMCAAFAKALVGLKTRFSIRCDSMLLLIGGIRVVLG